MDHGIRSEQPPYMMRISGGFRLEALELEQELVEQLVPDLQ
jgi:hypothetical protein